MVMEVSEANGRGKCHQCGKNIGRGKVQLIIQGFGWCDRRICFNCLKQIYEIAETIKEEGSC